MGAGTTEREVNHESDPPCHTQCLKSWMIIRIYGWSEGNEAVGEGLWRGRDWPGPGIITTHVPLWFSWLIQAVISLSLSRSLSVCKSKPDAFMSRLQLTVWTWPQCAVWPACWMPGENASSMRSRLCCTHSPVHCYQTTPGNLLHLFHMLSEEPLHLFKDSLHDFTLLIHTFIILTTAMREVCPRVSPEVGWDKVHLISYFT